MTAEFEVQETDPEARPDAGSLAIRLIRAFVRLTIVAALGTALGVAAYFGVPAVYRDLVEPVRSNSQRIVALEDQLGRADEDARQETAHTSERLAAAEGRIVEQSEALSELRAELERLQAELEGQGESVAELEAVPTQVQDVEDEVEGLDLRIGALEEALASTDTPVARVGRQLQLIRTMEMVTRARLWLMENDLGSTADEVRAAHDVLDELLEVAPEEEADTLLLIVDRLELTLKDLRESPVVAADDLEVAWRLLIEATAP